MTLADQLHEYGLIRGYDLQSLDGDDWETVFRSVANVTFLRAFLRIVPYPVLTPEARCEMDDWVHRTTVVYQNCRLNAQARGMWRDDFHEAYRGRLIRSWWNKFQELARMDLFKFATPEREKATVRVLEIWNRRWDFIVRQVARKADYGFWVKVYAKPWPERTANDAAIDFTQEFLAIAGNQAQKSRKSGGSMLFYVPDYLPVTPGHYLMRYVIEPVLFAGDEKIAYTYEVE